MLDPATTKRTALVNHIFRILTRGMLSAKRVPGASFLRDIGAWSAQHSTAIVIVELRSGDIGRLFYQKGRLVYAGYGDFEPAMALQRISTGLIDGVCTVVELTQAQASLAAASVDGRLTYSGVLPTRLELLLQDLSERGFSGVVCLESGNQISLWQLDVGVLISRPENISELDRARMMQIEWVERELPGIAAGSDSSLDPAGALRPQPKSAVRASATLAASAQVTANDGGQSTDALWTAFESILRSQIGERTDRILVMLRERHALESPDTLLQSLSKPLEHVAGVESLQRLRSLIK